MGKQKWSEKKLRSAIKASIYDRHLQNKPVDREWIQAKYLRKAPKHAEFITRFIIR